MPRAWAGARWQRPLGILARKGLAPKTWADLNRPELTVVFDIGSLHETAARRYCPKAKLLGYKAGAECNQALQSGRADAFVQAALLGLTAVARTPSIGSYYLLSNPTVSLPSSIGVQREQDTRFREVVDGGLEMNRGTGQIREWMLEGLALAGVAREQAPADLEF